MASPPESYVPFNTESQFQLSIPSPTIQTVPTFGGLDTLECLPASSLLPATEQLLTSLYFDHIQPIFPLFRKPVFYQQLITHGVPDMLLAAMFAISSRFIPPRRMDELFSAMSNPGDHFSHIAQQKLERRLKANYPITLIDVKVACLLALYEYTKSPSRQGWVLVGNAVRLALMAQLHQVDCLDSRASGSPGEMEEWRFVWWTIWRLDCTVNVTACTPFGIDRQMIGTNLVTTTVEDFTAGNVEAGVSIFPEMDPVKFWTSPAGPQLCDAGDGFNTHLFATSLLRAVSECQQRLNIKPSEDEIKRIAELDDILSSVHCILPDSFFHSRRQETEGVHSHRLRLETIVMLNTAQLIIHEPVNPLMMTMALPPDSRTVSLKSWQDSITFARAIADVLNGWPPNYFAVSDPIISCAIWHAYCGLTLYGMSGLKASTSGSTVEESLHILRTSLEKYTTYWPIARVLQDSLQIMQAWSWATVDIRKLR
ncbi:hypothetical protein FE257_000210 [Aspergillus nanangensis]|uniref:Xylanolytic transcriptional activator regulatory domain-containing protein n=1 Tax=Aspergillus nanangensis TaxID=2582783 RepID=A0AAD4CYZ0_ASPNN|nr:hypothetical protein FE257_000210 [Aspergillus nanangensis]